MVTLNIPLVQIQSFLLIFLRVGAILFSAPIISGQSIPAHFRIGLILSISFLISSSTQVDLDLLDGSIITFALQVAAEIAVGLIIGFVVRTIFTGIQLAGQIAGYQMGLSIANVIDPASNSQVPILSQLFNLFAMLFFLSLNAHHWFIKAVSDSFQLVPPLQYKFTSALVSPILDLTGNIFVIAIKVSAPILVSLLLTTVALGLIARTVTQMHIFVIAMPLKIVIGLIFLSLTLPYLAAFLNEMFNGVGYELFGVIKLLS